jgi:hypothetical protein
MLAAKRGEDKGEILGRDIAYTGVGSQYEFFISISISK